MPRTARLICPGQPHHITQRSASRDPVFRTRADARVYLNLLREHRGESVAILAYCLMPTHTHLIAVPTQENALADALRRVHGRFAQYSHARHATRGHVWQNRFYSCPMGPAHLWTAIRYVETNPIRAGLAANPEDYEWSSVRAHLTGIDPENLLDMAFHQQSGGPAAWKQLLSDAAPESGYAELRRATQQGTPFAPQAPKAGTFTSAPNQRR